jgi:hypothetical protein
MESLSRFCSIALMEKRENSAVRSRIRKMGRPGRRYRPFKNGSPDLFSYTPLVLIFKREGNMLRHASFRLFRGVTLTTLVLLSLALLLPTPARAQLLFTLDNPSQAGFPGQTLTFTGTLTNTGTSTVFLFGDTFSLAGVGLTLDDEPFLANAPLSLGSGDIYAGQFFTVEVGIGALPQIAAGAFTILGGPSDTSQNELATQNFQVNVSAPEPASLALFLPGVTAILLSVRRFRSRTC